MKKLLIVAAALCGALVANSAGAGNGTPINTGSANTLTLAVFGDWPYSSLLLNAAPLLLDSINSDPKVRLVMHVGDIHSGSMLCTLQWNLQIHDLFQQFKDPLVYTPGDNEWTDCHRPAEGNQNPLTELANIRSLFFPTPVVREQDVARSPPSTTVSWRRPSAFICSPTHARGHPYGSPAPPAP